MLMSDAFLYLPFFALFCAVSFSVGGCQQSKNCRGHFGTQSVGTLAFNQAALRVSSVSANHQPGGFEEDAQNVWFSISFSVPWELYTLEAVVFCYGVWQTAESHGPGRVSGLPGLSKKLAVIVFSSCCFHCVGINSLRILNLKNSAVSQN